jgi:hypothetical protein
MTFDLEAFCNSFNPTNDDRPSPDWDDPVMAHRLMHEVPKLAHSIGLRPPFGWDEDCWHQELRETLIKRSRGKGKWDPTRGRTKWSSWACMVMQSRNANLFRYATSKKANVIMLCTAGQVESGLIENYSGEGIGLQNGIPKWQRSAKAAGQRASRAAAQRLRRAAKAQAGQGSGRGLEAATGAPAGL